MNKVLNRINTIVLELKVGILHLIGDNIPSHHVRRFFYRLAGMKIGKGSAIHMGGRFYNPGNIKIGEDSIIGEDVVLDGRDKLLIGNHVAFATGVMVYNAQHDIRDPNFQAVQAPVIIHDYVFIGPRAVILPGVTVKKGAIIAAGSVVNKDVGEGEIVKGNPAIKVGDRNLTDFHYKLGRAAWFR